ncbi:hypothetical protein ACIOEZ_07340 [Streptomyces sp. NPDC087866]|uniref:hypothetical protein n=1 Tax=unclassified Streptomyces TaxID=2593676 RepID=UPI0033B54783
MLVTIPDNPLMDTSYAYGVPLPFSGVAATYAPITDHSFAARKLSIFTATKEDVGGRVVAGEVGCSLSHQYLTESEVADEEPGR